MVIRSGFANYRVGSGFSGRSDSDPDGDETGSATLNLKNNFPISFEFLERKV